MEMVGKGHAAKRSAREILHAEPSYRTKTSASKSASLYTRDKTPKNLIGEANIYIHT